MKSACSKLGLRHISCAAHSLHLVVADALLQKSNERKSTSGVEGVGENENRQVLESGCEDVSAFVDSSTSPDVEFQQRWWMDVQLETLESTEDIDRDNSQCEPSEWISDADIDDLCREVATFVSIVEKVASDKVNSSDLESVRQTVRSFRKISTYFHHSQKGTNRLEKLQSDKKNPLALKTDCPTRWNSTLAMMQRFVELQSTLQQFFFYVGSPKEKKEFSDDPTKKLKLPSSDQWFTMQCLVELLAPFSVATERLDAESYPTLVSLYCVISSLKVMLRDEGMFDELYANVDTEPFALPVLSKMQSVRRSFLALMEKRFDSKTDNQLLWISLFDPYTTNTRLFTPDEFNAAKTKLLAEMLIVKRAAVRAPYEDQPPASPSPEKTLKDAEDRARRQFQHLMYAARMSGQSEETSDEQLKADCEAEFGNYIQLSSKAKVSKDSKKPPSPLAWWKKHHTDFPILAPLARKWLGCIATSVPSERAFSTAGNTITKRRSALKANTVRDIIFMAQNATIS